jgi:hypothetical protein
VKEKDKNPRRERIISGLIARLQELDQAEQDDPSEGGIGAEIDRCLSVIRDAIGCIDNLFVGPER